MEITVVFSMAYKHRLANLMLKKNQNVHTFFFFLHSFEAVRCATVAVWTCFPFLVLFFLTLLVEIMKYVYTNRSILDFNIKELPLTNRIVKFVKFV
jgi:hypothetical protein